MKKVNEILLIVEVLTFALAVAGIVGNIETDYSVLPGVIILFVAIIIALVRKVIVLAYEEICNRDDSDIDELLAKDKRKGA